MGVLDDAIREHLELKRQHGAPEEELQRQEEEALGPARREVTPAGTAGGDGEDELEPAAVADDELEAAAPAADEAEEAPASEAEEAAPASEAPAAEPHEQATVLQEPEQLVEADSAAERGPLDEPAPTSLYDAAADMPDFEDEEDASAEPEAFEPGGREPLDAGAEDEDEDDEELFADVDEDEEAPESEQAQAEPSDVVLEDTPDFLQETPEHDRLWFEQKPPRDFDFD